ncbi:MAG: EAL domain-containing protein [Pseudomonadales bacterium]
MIRSSAGFASLSYLQQFPINTLRIDKSFVSSINENEEATSIVDAIVAMAKGLKLNLSAVQKTQANNSAVF